MAEEVLEKLILEKFEKKIRGKHSTVYVLGGRVVKVFKKDLSYNFWKEVAFLSYLQPRGFVPKIYAIQPSSLSITMEYIDGENIGELAKNGKLSAKMVIDCLDVCRTLDTLMIQKEEMSRPEKHIIFRDGEPYFIDFERSVITPKPANVTQFTSYLTKKFKIESELTDLVKEYKRKFDEASYSELRSNLMRVLSSEL